MDLANSKIWQRFHDVEMRIGNVKETGSILAQFTKNRLVATYGAANKNMNWAANVQYTASGRYLTLQSIKEEHLAVDDVSVTVLATAPEGN